MTKEELIGKLQMVYVGDKNALDEMVGYYDGLKQGIEELQHQNQKYKEVIDKAIKRLEKDYKFANYDIPLLTKDEQLAGKLLEILKEVE